MGKFNVKTTRPAVGRGPIVASATPNTLTYEGAPGHLRDVKGELFMLAVANFVGEDTFYEKAGDRDSRFAALVRRVAVDDVEWLTGMIRWLRRDANMRSAPVVAAAEAVKARLDAGLHGGNRQLVDAAMDRADEPGEFIAYWRSRFGRSLPNPVKNGVADAVARLYNERSLLKYDTATKGYRFADVIDTVRPEPTDDVQSALFRHALDRRHGRAADIPVELRLLLRRTGLMLLSPAERRQVLADPERLRQAGMTWEALSGWLDGPMDRQAWECVAEGTRVWLPDGTTAPIEQVVREALPVLSYDREWDIREPRPGRAYPPYDDSIGQLCPTTPVRWIDNGPQEVFAVTLASGRVVEATANHRWVIRMRDGSRRPLWRTTEQVQPGWAVPVPLSADYFGTLGDEWDGWFIGEMLGDGNMTHRTPVWAGHDDGTLDQMRMYASKHGCEVHVEQAKGCLRVRITDPVWHRNAVRDFLIEHQVWGLKSEGKRLANLPYSRSFICGFVAGLIDSDGSVGAKDVEFANISEILARQVADALLRLGIQARVSSKRNNRSPKPLWRVRVSDVSSIRRLYEAVQLRSRPKAEALARLVAQDRDSRRAATGPRGYDATIAWDRVVSVRPAGVKRTYCVEVTPSHLWVANGVITGNCIIPSMGLMALARNLRNFDEAGVSDAVAETVAARFADPEQVARSRMFPFRWLAAYEQAPSLRWGHALDKALQASLANVPAMPGRSLVLVDTSASMAAGLSEKSKMTPLKAAAVFGVALAARGEQVDLHGFADGVFRHDVPKGASVVREVARFCAREGEVGHGTEIAGSLRRTFRGHDRVFVISDMQTMGGRYGQGVSQAVPANVPLYGFNLGGYQPAAFDVGAPNRIEFGGLTDATFRMVPLIESGRSQNWPWLT